MLLLTRGCVCGSGGRGVRFNGENGKWKDSMFRLT